MSLRIVKSSQYKLDNAVRSTKGLPIEVWHICTASKYDILKNKTRYFVLLRIVEGITENWYLNEYSSSESLSVIEDDAEYLEVATFINDELEKVQGWKWKDLPKMENK